MLVCRSRVYGNLLPVRSVVFVMNVVIFAEHSLLMEQTMDPIEQRVFEEIEKHKLSGEFGPRSRGYTR